jgi:hypothetical protein
MPLKSIHRALKVGGIGTGIIPGSNFDSINYISYIVIFILFILSIVSIYNTKVSLLGILLLYLVNIVYSIILSKDVLASPKSNHSSIISFIIIAILVLNIVSSTMIIDTLRKLHTTYLKNKETLKLSDKNRNKLSLYIALWILSLITIIIITAFFFIEPIGELFFNYMFIDKELSPTMIFAGFIIKIICIVISLSSASYMMYIADKFYTADKKTLQ